MPSIQDEKKTEKGKLRLAGPSAVPNAPTLTLIGNNNNKNQAKGHHHKSQEDVAPGAVAVRDRTSSRGSTKSRTSHHANSPGDDELEVLKYGEAPSRWRASSRRSDNRSSGVGGHKSSRPSDEKHDNDLRKHKKKRHSVSSSAAPGSSSWETARRRKEARNQLRRPPREASDDKPSGDVEMSLVHAEKATEDADLDALVNERLQQMAVGVAAPVEVQRDEEEEIGDKSGKTNGNCRKLPLIILAGVVVVSGAVVGSIALLREDSNAPTTARTQKVEAILADYTPWNEQAMAWLTDTDTWEPDDGDPNSEYLWMERYVMADLYYTTNGPNWNINDDWLSTLPVCNWSISLSSSSPNQCPGPIKDLGLWVNSLKSSIPSSIGSLTDLTALNFQWNQLTSTIPSSIGDLSQLTYLALDNNQLTSSIPSSLGNLTKLTYLYLDGNKLSGSIPMLPYPLRDCNLRDNCFQNIVNGETIGCYVSDCPNDPPSAANDGSPTNTNSAAHTSRASLQHLVWVLLLIIALYNY